MTSTDPFRPTSQPTGGWSEETADARQPRLTELHWAMAGGAFAAGGVFTVAALVGHVSSFEARRLVEGLKPTAAFAASTYIATGATILALIATMVAFSISHESEFRNSYYRRIGTIARLTTALIVVAIALMTMLGVPIAQGDAASRGYVVLYWAILVISSLGGGLTVTIVLMLNYAVRGLIDLGSHGTSFVTVGDPDIDGPSWNINGEADAPRHVVPS